MCYELREILRVATDARANGGNIENLGVCALRKATRRGSLQAQKELRTRTWLKKKGKSNEAEVDQVIREKESSITS